MKNFLFIDGWPDWRCACELEPLPGAEVSISLSEILDGGPDGEPPIEPRFTFR